MSRTRSGVAGLPRGPDLMDMDELAAQYAVEDEGEDEGPSASSTRLNREKERKRKERAKEQRAKEKKVPSQLEKLKEVVRVAEATAPDTQMQAYSQSQIAFRQETQDAMPVDEEEEDDVDLSKYLNDGEDNDEGEDDGEDDQEKATAAGHGDDLFFTAVPKPAPAVPTPTPTPVPVPVPAKKAAPEEEEGQYMTDTQATAKATAKQNKQRIETMVNKPKPKPVGEGVNFTVAQGEAVGITNSTFVRKQAQPVATPTPTATPNAMMPPPPPEGALRFFWIDAREDGFGLTGTGGSHAPGTVYLFGKVFKPDGSLESCCVRVGGLQRQVFFLPRTTRKGTDEPLPIIEAQKEVSALCSQLEITQRKVQARDRWYGFEEPGITRDKAKWIKLSYPATFRELNVSQGKASDVQKYLDTCTHAFGDGRSFLEMFLLKKRLKGPCWVDITSFTAIHPDAQMSHCASEYSTEYKKVNLSENWEQIPSPPLKLVSLAMHTDLVEARGGQANNEIFALSACFYNDVDIDRPRARAPQPGRFCGLRPAPGGRLPPPHETEAYFKQRGATSSDIPSTYENESQLITNFLAVVAAQDPDILCGHNFLSYDLDVLLHRCAALRIPTWDRLGRMRLRYIPKLQAGAGGLTESTWEERSVLGGRLIADSYLLAHEYHKTNNYKLRSLAQELKLEGLYGSVTLPALDINKTMSTPEGLMEVVTRAGQKAVLQFQLVDKLQCVPLTKRLTYLSGNLWSRTLTGSRAERIEYLLLHDFYAQKYILPDKRRIVFQKKNTKDEAAPARRKAKYAGGMVLEPKKGLYTDYVLLLDFNSLYPSIIQEYKICFSTVDREEQPLDVDDPDNNHVVEVPPEANLYCSECAEQFEDKASVETYCRHKGVLPKAIRKLVSDRRKIKKALAYEKDPSARARYDIIQKALKLTANSIYGCLGFEHSRFHAQQLAELVTFKGREALSATIDLVESLPEHQLSVVYGDTDSVMLNTSIPNTAPIQEAIQKAQIVKDAVNKRYSNLEIDIDGIFKSILLVRKKKYAAMNITDWNREGKTVEKEIKGLDMVRRDWCPFTSEVQERTLDFCLSGDDEETVRSGVIEYLQKVAGDVRGNEVAIDKYLITKSLTKEPTAYLDHSQPHVTVALRMRQVDKLPVRVGDLVHYIVCTDTSAKGLLGDKTDTKKISNRAFTKDEVIRNSLTIDKEWYLQTQFHPPVMRLTEHISGLDSHVIAHCFGIESSATTEKQDRPTELGAATAGDSSYVMTATGQKKISERFYPLELQVPCTGCKSEVALNTHDIVCDILEVWDDTLPKCRIGAGLFRCACGALFDLKLVSEIVVRSIRERQTEYFSDATGYESHFQLDNVDANRRLTDRHTRDYVDFTKAMFSLQELCQVIITHVNGAKEDRLVQICGQRGRTGAARIAVEKVWNVMTDGEQTHFNNISLYLQSISRRFARNTVDIGGLFSTITKFSGRQQ